MSQSIGPYAYIYMLSQNFLCPICLELARKAVESQCCSKIFCEVCWLSISKQFSMCPCCKTPKFTCQESRISRRIINEIKVPCQYCGLDVENGHLEEHYRKCPQKTLPCKYCRAEFKQSQMVDHSLSQHKQETYEHLLQKMCDKKVHQISMSASGLNFSQVIVADSAFKPTFNRNGILAKLGESGKYYCGGPLIGKCHCCDGFCGPTNGENCDACMEADMKRLKLSKGYMVNRVGYISRVSAVDKTAACMRNFGKDSFFSSEKTCGINFNCSDCKILEYALSVGRYARLY